jgi:hypothetical protein
LIGSLLKFFKINDDASVSNKDLGENESGEPVKTKCDSSGDEIVCKYRATAEATCLKWPTSVRDHNASAVAVENQHKMLEKVSESYDCEPEKSSISCDLGEQIIPLSDSQQCSIVHKGHICPELSDEECVNDEKSGHFRKFHCNRILKNDEKQNWLWLVYSETIVYYLLFFMPIIFNITNLYYFELML